MRIAIPVTDGQIANHLGVCRQFLLADVKEGTVESITEVENPGHGPGGPPPLFLADQGVKVVVAWGMPPHARGLFARFGIEYVLGATGEPRKALQDYLSGTLKLTDQGLDGGPGGCGSHG